MVSGKAGKMSHIQALRAYAAFAVVLYHVSARSTTLLHRTPGPSELSWGATGVDTFFVLSGFIIMTVHRRDISRRSELRPYLIKRAVRIYPIYWLVTLAALPFYFGGYGVDTKRNTDVIVRSFTLFPQHPGVFPIVNVGWTLSYEIFFYLVFALLIAAPLRVAVPVVVAWLVPCAVVLVLAASGAWYPPLNLLWFFLFNPRNLEFALGAAIAIVGPAVTLPHARRWLLGGLAGIVGVAVVVVHTHVRVQYMNVLFVGPLTGVMVLAAAQLDRVGKAAPRLLEMVGDASYSLYLVHFATLTFLFIGARHLHAVNDVTWPMLCVIGPIVCVAVSLAVYRLVEAPFLRVARRRLLPPASAHVHVPTPRP